MSVAFDMVASFVYPSKSWKSMRFNMYDIGLRLWGLGFGSKAFHDEGLRRSWRFGCEIFHTARWVRFTFSLRL